MRALENVKAEDAFVPFTVPTSVFFDFVELTTRFQLEMKNTINDKRYVSPYESSYGLSLC